MEQKRGALARIGITLLNLFAPGLGLLRLARWKAALAAYGVIVATMIFMNIAPPAPFSLVALFVLVALASYLISMAATWILGRAIDLHPPRYAQWYGIVGAAIIAFLISCLFTDQDRIRYRSFYTPAEGMAPTLPTGDRLIAYMRAPQELRRGDLLLVRAPNGSIYIKRLAALPGDRIALKDGIVILNGSPIPQRKVATETIEFAGFKETVGKMNEQFPGEPVPHLVYDSGPSSFDTIPEQIVQPRHIFVLGDNRDHSADSRVPLDQLGLEQVAVADIAGWPLYHSFRSSRPMGTAINREGMK